MSKPVRGAVAVTAFCGIAGLAALQPISAAAAAPLPQATASASAVSLSLNPSALLSLPAPVVSALNALPSIPLIGGSDVLKGLTGEITATIAAVNANGALTTTAGDLANGHADNTVLSVNNAALATVLATLKTALDGALVPSQLSAVPGAGSAVAALITALGQVTAPLTQALGADGSLAQAISVDLPPAGQHSFGTPTLPLVSNSVSNSLVTAVNKASGTPLSLGPEADAHQTAASLAELQTLSLSGLANPALLTSATSELTATVAPLTTAITTLTTLNALPTLPANLTLAVTALNTLKTAVPALATVIDPVITALGNPGASVSTALAAVQGILAQVQSVINTVLPSLTGLLNSLPSISLGGLLNTSGVVSSSTIQPQSNGVHTKSVAGITDIAIGTLPAAIPAIGSKALLEVKNVGSSADAFVNGTDTSAPTGTTGVGEIDVLGTKVLDSSTLPQGLSKSFPVSIPNLGTLTLVVNVGKAVLVNNSATRKTVQSSALDIQLLNGDAAGANALSLLGAGGGRLIDLNMASAAVDGGVQALTTNPTAAGPTPSALPPTGLFGPAALGFGAGLGLLGIGLGVESARRRRTGS